MGISVCAIASRLSRLLLLSTFASGIVVAQDGLVQPLIVQPMDEGSLTTLKGNVHPLAQPQFDVGAAPANLPMERMLLVLKRSAEQESALRKLLDDQQDKSSLNYHKWLTPEQFGKQFGLADNDVQTVTTWLQSHGFQVTQVSKGRTIIEFSGTAAQVQAALHTSIHQFVVNGEPHLANASDPQIPAALAPAVAGVLTLHNFLKQPQSHLVKEPAAAQLVPGKKPQVSFSQNGKQVNALSPQDYATIYNINPLYQENLIGQGAIAVVGRSNLFNLGQDVRDFYNIFGTCCSGFNIILNGPDPGDLGGGEEAEATLDTTWASAIAPGAVVHLVVSASTNTTDGVDLSELYIVDNNLADIMTESFGSCELFASDAQLAGTNALAEQAAAQGITYVVSTGDNGAEGCDRPSLPPAKNPISVNQLASTPYTIAVGGTMFNENGQQGKYWGIEPPVAESALSYIPESVWNESGATTGLWSGSGGASAGNIQNGGTTPGVPKPGWQSGVVGIPNDGVRDLPDVSLTAAGHDPYLLCLRGSCEPNGQGQFFIYFASGTSASAPSFAGIMALVNQQVSRTTGQARQGQANYVLYRLAAAQSAYPSQCNGSSTTTSPASTCIFNDVSVGNNVVPGESGSLYQAAAGYDLATGLGSVNVTNLVNQWTSVSFNPTTTTLALGSASITHGSPMPFTITVAPTSGTAVPSGNVFLLAYTGPFGETPTSVGFFPLSGGAISSSTDALPGGIYLLTAHYAGDGIFASSTSVGTDYITVAPEPSVITESIHVYDEHGLPIAPGSVPFGSFIYVRADVRGNSGQGIPTGTVTFTDTAGALPGGNSFPINSQGNTANPHGIVFDAGNHAISASYSGDTSFNPGNTAQSLSITVLPGFFASIPAGGSPVVIGAPGSSGNTSVTIGGSTGFSGTISLSCSGLPPRATCAFTPSSITATGTPMQTSASIFITTAAPSAALGPNPQRYLFAGWVTGTGLLFSTVLIAAPKRRRQPWLVLLLVCSLSVAMPACGGGSSSSPPPVPKPGTPAGTYRVTVNAASDSITSSTAFSLVVE